MSPLLATLAEFIQRTLQLIVGSGKHFLVGVRRDRKRRGDENAGPGKGLGHLELIPALVGLPKFFRGDVKRQDWMTGLLGQQHGPSFRYVARALRAVNGECRRTAR